MYVMPVEDTLVDSTANNELLPFMDGFSCSNQISIIVEDIPKTTFRCLDSIRHLNGWSCLLVLKM